MTVIGDQDIFRLEIPVVDPERMAELDGIQELQENVLGKSIVTDEASALGDVGKEIAFWAVLNNHKCAVGAVQYAHQRDHVGMLAGLIVHGDFSSLESLLTGVQSMFGQGLDGVEFVGVDVDGLVYNTVRAHSKDGDEFQSVCQDTAESIFGSDTC